MRQRPLAVLTGPTGTGKTDAALALAREFPLEIVSVDSAQVYRGLDIGSAKPAPDIRARVRHHLLDLVEPTASYSAGQFVRDATAAIADIEARGRVPLLVGGTMLYLRALIGGIAELPEASSELRARIDAEAAEQGWPALHARLAALDAAAAARGRASARPAGLYLPHLSAGPRRRSGACGGASETRSRTRVVADKPRFAVAGVSRGVVQTWGGHGLTCEIGDWRCEPRC